MLRGFRRRGFPVAPLGDAGEADSSQRPGDAGEVDPVAVSLTSSTAVAVVSSFGSITTPLSSELRRLLSAFARCFKAFSRELASIV